MCKVLMDAVDVERLDFCMFSQSLLPRTDMFEIEALGEVSIDLLVRRDHPLSKQGIVTVSALRGYPIASGAQGCHVMRDDLPPPTIICKNFGLLPRCGAEQ